MLLILAIQQTKIFNGMKEMQFLIIIVTVLIEKNLIILNKT